MMLSRFAFSITPSSKLSAASLSACILTIFFQLQRCKETLPRTYKLSLWVIGGYLVCLLATYSKPCFNIKDIAMETVHSVPSRGERTVHKRFLSFIAVFSIKSITLIQSLQYILRSQPTLNVFVLQQHSGMHVIPVHYFIFMTLTLQ